MEEQAEYNAGKKGERIAFVRWNTKDDICPVPLGLQCGGAKSCDECKVGMTRSEAIERIVKAIAIKYFEGVFSCENEEIEEYAEAALNALLGEKI